MVTMLYVDHFKIPCLLTSALGGWRWLVDGWPEVC